MLRAILFASLCALLTGCSTTEGIQVRVMRPAPVDLRHYDVVAVDRFSGQGCDRIADDLADALRNSVNPLTGRNDFEVVDRRDVDRMLENLRGRPGGQEDRTTTETLERWRSAKMVLKGETHAYEVREEVIEEPFVDLQGLPHVSVTRRAAATVAAEIQAHDTESGRVYDAAKFHEVVKGSSSAVDAEPRLLDHDGMLDTARQRMIGNYMRRVQPHWDTVWVHLYTDGDLPQLQVGNGFAKMGDWDAALQSYAEALEFATGELAEVRFKPLFNLGVAQCYTNQFDAARRSMKEAYALGRDDSILRELQRLSGREQEYQRLMEQSGQPAAKPAAKPAAPAR